MTKIGKMLRMVEDAWLGYIEGRSTSEEAQKSLFPLVNQLLSTKMTLQDKVMFAGFTMLFFENLDGMNNPHPLTKELNKIISCCLGMCYGAGQQHNWRINQTLIV